MKATPIERNIIDQTIDEFHLADFAKATIREVKAIAAKAEALSGVEFIKMEMGVPRTSPFLRRRRSRNRGLEKRYSQPVSGHQRTPHPQNGSLSVCKGIHQRRHRARRLRTGNRIHARHVCLVPHLQPMRPPRKTPSFLSIRGSLSKNRTGRNGTKI